MQKLVHMAAGLALTAATVAAQGTNPAANFPPERWARPAVKSAAPAQKSQLPQSDQPARASRAAKKPGAAAKPVPYPADHAAVETQQAGTMQPPSRPEQWPAVAPRVSYQNGMLTVVAENSMLSDVLNAIKSATGAKFDFTSGGAQERVAASIGPAPPRQVLMTLLNGSHYDYIILGSETDAAQVQSVVLTPKANAQSGQSAVNAYNPPPQPVQRQVPQISPDQAAGNDENEGFAEPADQNQDQNQDQEDQDNSGQTPTNQAMPNQQPQYPQLGQPVNPQQPGTNPNGEGQVKSPEQLLQELRRMQQQQNQQNPNNPQTQRPDRPQ